MEFEEGAELVELIEYFNVTSNSSLCLGEDCDDVTVPSFVLILTQIVYCLIFCAGVFGNTLVIYVVLTYPSLHTVTNTYILNLAIADECFLLGNLYCCSPSLTLACNFRCSLLGGHDDPAGLEVREPGLHPLHGLHLHQPDDELPLPDGPLG